MISRDSHISAREISEVISISQRKTEENIAKAVKNILKNRTTLVITHRLHTIRTSDIILVMKDGEIIAQGQHDDLLKSSADYRKVFGKHLEDRHAVEEGT